MDRRETRRRSRRRREKPGLRRWKYGISFCLLLALWICGFHGHRYRQMGEGRNTAEEFPPQVSLDARDREKWQELLGENQISEEFREGLDAFAFESGTSLLRQGQGNVNYSPLSAYYALALAGCGAEGQTASEILALLHMDSQEELAAQCQKLYQWFYYVNQWKQGQNRYYGGEEEGDAIKISSSVWVSESADIEKEYRYLASRQFFAPCLSVDFKSPKAGEAMGEWIAQRTNRAISAPIFPDPENRVSILNTLYFYGGWQNPFDEDNTKEDIFTLAGGEVSPCLFLNQTIEYGSFRKGEGFMVSCLGTADSELVFLLPEEGRRPEDFLESPQIFEEMMNPEKGEWETGEITWKIPRFSVKSSMDLKSLFQAMGIQKMFGETGEFGRLSRNPMWISDMVQETVISVDESGVEGAAYTVMESEAADMEEDRPVHADMILDRPFLYGIRAGNGTWLFLGIYRSPEDYSR